MHCHPAGDRLGLEHGTLKTRLCDYTTETQPRLRQWIDAEKEMWMQDRFLSLAPWVKVKDPIVEARARGQRSEDLHSRSYPSAS